MASIGQIENLLPKASWSLHLTLKNFVKSFDMLKKRLKYSVALIFVMLLFSTMGVKAHACKDRIYPDNFPISEIESYDQIVIATPIKMQVEKKSGRYAPPFSMTFLVTENLKGTLQKGDKYIAKTSSASARARCPITLSEGKPYLLFFNGDRKNLTVPRYGSLYLAQSSEKFNKYTEAIRNASQNDRWNTYRPKIPKGTPPEALCIEEGQEATGLVVKGDFDGDGNQDEARLEENSDKKKRRLSVYFNKSTTPFVVEEKSARYSGNYLSLAKRSKSSKSDRISYGSCEASEVILTWDKAKKKFTENWVSD